MNKMGNKEIDLEKAFRDLTDLILSLKFKGATISQDVNLIKKWQDKSQHVLECINGLSVEDRKVLDMRYKEWYDAQVKLQNENEKEVVEV